MQRVESFYALLNAAGADGAVLNDRDTAHLVADGQTLLSRQTIPGVAMKIDEQDDITLAKIRIARNQHIHKPIHLCFGLLQRIGGQRFNLAITLEAGAKATFIAHGLFANVERLRHRMEKTIELGEGSELHFSDSHIHGLSAGIDVQTKNTVKVGKKARYSADFSLTSGLVGKLDLKESVQADDEAVVELVSRVYGHQLDRISIDEKVSLNGRFSRSMIKSRVALEDEARADIVGVTEGRAEGARGHMDCLEIIKDQAIGQSTPIVKVCHPLAKITHEAAIGTVDKKQLETLIAHGLSPEQATDMIVLGMLR
ncbi:SufD family Fe-S cluster assembly protein [Methylomarinum sp. Ch1-1]|uniref:SufD family Fe-S cluster assembly protein n=1 Tax=Methylomarinum roseum TaxID=3067653 RepID=A0AAU7NRL0_9GAMM|nr:SufD family Fe-S cluster assembly protein [Methylomarinum sp. Ch1-1]MDP4520419.1 SufD family Fe-S cluster assembly protein [Methylomarinum sp. Ch1-1]